MKRQSLLLTLLVLLMISISACGILQEPEAASAPIEAVPLDVTDTAGQEEMDDADTTTAADANADENEVDDSEEMEESATEEPAVVEEPATSGIVIYQISPEASQVRFELDEDLRGNRITVVGSTDQVAGEIGVDLNNLAATEAGIIQINARALATDNNFRNRAIKNEILKTDDYEFITFEPTAVNGLPDAAAVGDEVSFTIDGNLTVRDITQPVTFELTVTVVSPEQISGTATTIINRGDFGLNIPSVPNVANVEEEVELYIDFVANAK
ncbi:MAG: YceI family protein [Anaerolineales bacterium]|nr:YceI family protein [Anaerolineales bacterium]